MPLRFASIIVVLASTVASLAIACTQHPASSPPATAGPVAAKEPPPASSGAPEEPAPSARPGSEPSPLPPPPVATSPAGPPDHDMARVLREANTPPELTERGDAAHIWDEWNIDHSINPFYLRGDFDGDGRPDYLVSVLGKAASAGPPNPRLVVLRGIAGKDAAVWLDEDAQLSTPARDGWYVHAARTKVPVGFDGSKPPRLVGDAIVMMKAESSSALVYWTGKRFASHWLTD